MKLSDLAWILNKRLIILFILVITYGLTYSAQVLAVRDSISFQHISTEDGLPQSTVNVIFQDSNGFMWFGTYDGLSRYDGYQFVTFKNDPSDVNSLSSNIVVSIIEDYNGYLWVATAQNGVNRFDPKTGEFDRFVPSNSDFDSLSHSKVYKVFEDPAHRIWVATEHGLNLYLPNKNAFAHFYNNPLDSQSLPSGAIVDITDDGDGNLWVASHKTLAHFNIERQTFKHFSAKEFPTQIQNLYLDTDKSLWVGTRLNGLYHLKLKNTVLPKNDESDKNKNNVNSADSGINIKHFQHVKTDAFSLSYNDVRGVLRTTNGDLWVATEEGGLNVRRKGDNRFQHFKRNSADPHSISINDIWSLYQDKKGLLWIGTAGGGINITESFENQFSRLTHAPYSRNGLSHELVWDIEQDSQGILWMATLNGLDRYDPKFDRFQHISAFITRNRLPVGNRIQSMVIDDENNLWFGNQQGQVAVYSIDKKITVLIERENYPEGMVSYNRIRMVEEDRYGHIWVSTDDGLLKIDGQTKKIISDYQFSEDGELGGSTVRTMLQDKQGFIWFGTWDEGLQKYDPEFNTITQFKNQPGDKSSLSNNTVRSLYMNSKGDLWIGTFNGLNKLSAENISKGNGVFESYLEKDGLPNSAIYGIESVLNGKLWLSTNKGLSQFDTTKISFRNYSQADGLPANEFNANAVKKTKNGDIYFGSVGGVAIVSAGDSLDAIAETNVVLTSVKVAGKLLKPEGLVIDQNSFEYPYQSNDITFEFVSLDFYQVQRNRFRYKLAPYNKDWIETNGLNQAVFTNLDPNKYTFSIQVKNFDGQWFDSSLNVSLIIEPPLWKTWWAYLIYVVSLSSLFLFLIQKQKKTLQEQRNINRHLRKLDQIKDEFLANTSHELRTPLNGIIGIAESLVEGSAGLQNQKTIDNLTLISDGGKRLAQLINDILDFKKLSHHSLILHRQAVDLHSVIEVVVSLLKPLAEKKELLMLNSVPADLPLMYADENRIQQIFHNLIGNAIKYTQKGTIEILARLNVNELNIRVVDTGVGIARSKLESIFRPFEQLNMPETLAQRGTGLGLSVTRQLVEQHDGQIWAQSQIGKGSIFCVTLPCWLDNVHVESDESDEVESENDAFDKPDFIATSEEPSNKSNDQKWDDSMPNKGVVLIADDDPINLQVLSDLLKMNGYKTVNATDGVQATRIGLEQKFDLAILDIMMPGMSGYEVTRTLREKYSAIELPILLLSARNQPGDVTAGFAAGANDYVTKPIERKVLLGRINTMHLLHQLVEAKREKQHSETLQVACEKLGRYFPKQMVKRIVTDDGNNPLIARRKKITVLFADLSGFTSISDRFEPEVITEILNSFLTKMGHMIEKHGGILNEILGDGLVVLFGAIDSLDKELQAKNAAKLALEMQSEMKNLAEQWLEAGFDHDVKLRVGIHQDFATVGNFGSKDIMAFRAVGSGVNFASRLESYSKPGEISVSYSIYAHCKNDFEFSSLQEIKFKGFNHKQRVCKLIAELDL
jgi:two-component system sensor histidine kinase ChiS